MMIMSTPKVYNTLIEFCDKTPVSLVDTQTSEYYYMDMTNVHMIEPGFYRLKVSYTHLHWVLLVRFSPDMSQYICVFEDANISTELKFLTQY